MEIFDFSFDWSSDIAQTDPDDSRIAASTVFLQMNAVCDEVGIGDFPGAKVSFDYFTAQGSRAIFTSTWDADERVSALKLLVGRVSGSTPLYDAVRHAVQLTQQNAKLAGISLYTFAFNSAAQDLSALQRLATQINGAMLYASLEASCCWSLSASLRRSWAPHRMTVP